ncbi:MAG: translesion DNA synthesis-associated protein ImuA, partial [Rubrivivax sp.]
GGATAEAAAEDLHPAPQAPEDLHPALWRAHQLGRSRGVTVASGYTELDAVLPGGGWPAGSLSELLLPHAGLGELRLLAPALAAVQAQQRDVMLFDPPAQPCAWVCKACGLDLQQLYVVHSRAAAQGRAGGPLPAVDLLWALEQALKSGHVGAVLAWLPARLSADALRRLQLAAQGHDGPAFLLRDAAVRHKPSPAPLRLLLRAADRGAPDMLRVQLLKRRGPPLLQPLLLALPPVLSAPALARARRLATGAATVAASAVQQRSSTLR